jgi:general secretion pathway protein G
MPKRRGVNGPATRRSLATDGMSPALNELRHRLVWMPYNLRELGCGRMKTATVTALVCLGTLVGCNVSDPGAKIALAKTDIRAIATALDLYRVDYLRYPTAAEGLRALVERATNPAALLLWHKGGYLRTLPKDPRGHDYQYAYPSTHGEVFDLYSLGPSGDGDKPITNWKTRAD